MIENHLTSTGISIRQSPPADILVLVQETPFTDLQYKEINRLLKEYYGPSYTNVLVTKTRPAGAIGTSRHDRAG